MGTAFKLQSDDLGKLLIRVAVAVMLPFHGVFKLEHGVAWITQLLDQDGLPGFLAYGVYLAEVVAPILIVMGWKTRLASLVVGFDLFMALVLALKGRIFTVREAGGGWSIEVEMFFILCSLALFFMGGGRYSIARGRGKWD
jgi:putative oxidoreductase